MEIIYIILGWLFWILSPGIINYISNHYKKNTLKLIVTTELNNIKNKLIFLPLLVYSKYGKLDEKVFNWMRKESQDFKEVEMSIEIKNIFEKQINNPDSLISFLQWYNSRHKKDNPGIIFRKMMINSIDSNLINIGILWDKFLEKLLEVKFQINVFNEEIQSVNEYWKMTFDSNITESNHQIILKEIENKNLYIAEKAILIIEKINTITP